jgi:hypothetical protein
LNCVLSLGNREAGYGNGASIRQRYLSLTVNGIREPELLRAPHIQGQAVARPEDIVRPDGEVRWKLIDVPGAHDERVAAEAAKTSTAGGDLRIQIPE